MKTNVRSATRCRSASSPKPKIVRILGRLTGGPARQACLLHEKLTPWFDTRLVTGGLAPGEHDMIYLLESEQNFLRLGHMGRRISFVSDLRALWDLYRLLRREQPQIVHTHTAKAGALGRVAAWMAGVPVIVHTYHGHVFHSYFSRSKTRFYLAIERALCSITTRVVAISNSQKHDLCRKYRVVSEEKTAVIHNGFHLGSFSSIQRAEARKILGIPEDAFAFVWAARMAPVKDVQLLGKVVQNAAASRSKAFFLVVGDGEERPLIESLVAGHENVKLMGWQRDMDQIWSAADAALLTSRNEGTPTALIEAMAAQLPFVSTDVGSVEDLAVAPLMELPNGMGRRAANGFLGLRTPESLLYCIEALVTDRAVAKRMGEAGNAFVRAHFPADRLVNEMNLLYRELLSHTKAAGTFRCEQTLAGPSEDAKTMVANNK